MMTTLVKLLLGAAMMGNLVSGADAVKAVTGVELDKLVAEGKTVFTKFYSPKCPHCVRVAPIWEELASQVASDASVVVAKVDCTQNRDTCKRFNVQGVPSLQLVKDGKVYLYKGARELAEFVTFLLHDGYQKAGVQVSSLPGAEKIKTLTEKAVETGTEVVQQLSAIASYSPLVVMLLLGLGFLAGASVTGLVAIAARPAQQKTAEQSAACASGNGDCCPSAAEKPQQQQQQQPQQPQQQPAKQGNKKTD